MRLPTVTVTGRIVTSNGPWVGPIWFIPTRLYIPLGRDAIAIIARRHTIVPHDEGNFAVELTPTSLLEPPFQYDVIISGYGEWRVKIPRNKTVQLSDLIVKKTKKPRA